MLSLLLLHAAGAGIGNQLSGKVCMAHDQFKYCWVPSWGGRSLNWTEFWTEHGHEVAPMAPMRKVDAVEAAVHVRCGDVSLNDHAAYPYACRACVVEALQWLEPHTHVVFVVGGHNQRNATDEKRRCAAIVGHYTSIFRDHKFDVTVRWARDKWDDWWLLHRAHKVLAVVPSSFSFTAKAHDLRSLRIIGGHDDPPVWQLCREARGFKLC